MEWTLKTEAAAKYFGKCVGDQVDDSDVQLAEGRNKPVTMERLLSLQSQFANARATRNKELQAAINRQFRHELTVYMDTTGESASDVLDELDSAHTQANGAAEGTVACGGMGLEIDLPPLGRSDQFAGKHESHEDASEEADDDDLILLRERDLLAHAWAIAARVVEINPDLRMSRVDQSRSLPLYIVHDDSEEFRLQFDLVASVWLSVAGADPVEYSWLDLIQTDLPATFIDDLRELGAIPYGGTSSPTRRSATYRLMSQILDLEAHSDAIWTLSNLTIDFSGQDRMGWYPAALLKGVREAVDDFVDGLSADVELMGERRVHQPLWVLERDLDQQLAVFDSNTGKVHLRDEVIDILGDSGGEPRSVRALAAHVLDTAVDPRVREDNPAELDRRLREFEESLQNATSATAATSNGFADMCVTLAQAGIDTPPLGEFEPERIMSHGDWAWGSRSFPALPLYTFDVEKVMAESFNSEPFFALAHAGHGVNSYGLNLVTSKGPVVVFAQHAWGGIYGDGDDQRAQINATYLRIKRLFDLIEDPAAESSWGWISSNFRGACGAVNLERLDRGDSLHDATTWFEAEERPFEVAEQRLFTFLISELEL